MQGLGSNPAVGSQVNTAALTAEYFGRIAKGVDGIEEEVRERPTCAHLSPLLLLLFGVGGKTI